MWTHGTELEAKLRLESAAGGDSPVPPPCRIERDGERDGREEKRLWRLTHEGNGGGRRPSVRTHRRGERRGRGGGCAALGGVVASGD